MRWNSNFPSRFLFDLETRIRGHFRFWKMSWQTAITTTTTENEVIVCQGTSNSETKNELKLFFFYIMS